MALSGDALVDFGDCVVGQPHQVPVVHRNPGMWYGGVNPVGVRRGQVDHDQLDV